MSPKEFVSDKYKGLNNLFLLKKDEKPKAVKGLDGVYSLKRLSEAI